MITEGKMKMRCMIVSAVAVRPGLAVRRTGLRREGANAPTMVYELAAR